MLEVPQLIQENLTVVTHVIQNGKVHLGNTLACKRDSPVESQRREKQLSKSESVCYTVARYDKLILSLLVLANIETVHGGLATLRNVISLKIYVSFCTGPMNKSGELSNLYVVATHSLHLVLVDMGNP